MQPDPTPEPKTAPQTRSNKGLIATAILLILVAIILVTTVFIQSEIETRAEKVIRKALQGAPNVADIKFSQVKISLWRQRLSLVDVTATMKSSGETLLIDRASFGGVDWESLKEIVMTRKAVVPKSFNLQLDNVHVPSGFIGAQADEFIRNLGQDSVRFSTYLQISRNPERKTFDLESFQIEMEDLGLLRFSVSLGNLTLPSAAQIAELKKDPKLFLATAGDITKLSLRGFEISFEDDSFVERASKSFIAMGEDSPISLVELAIQTNQPNLEKRDVASARAATDFTLPALEKLRDFLRKPNTITLASRPPKPIPILSVLDDSSGGSINDLAHRLSLVVE